MKERRKSVEAKATSLIDHAEQEGLTMIVIIEDDGETNRTRLITKQGMGQHDIAEVLESWWVCFQPPDPSGVVH